MNWLKENWFRIGILLALFSFVFVMLVVNRPTKDAGALQSNQTAIKTIDSITQQVPPAKPTQDPSIKIELCKTQARAFADNEARQVYLKASDDATARGDSTLAAQYLVWASEPSHPANYDINYQSKYIDCLNN